MFTFWLSFIFFINPYSLKGKKKNLFSYLKEKYILFLIYAKIDVRKLPSIPSFAFPLHFFKKLSTYGVVVDMPSCIANSSPIFLTWELNAEENQV